MARLHLVRAVELLLTASLVLPSAFAQRYSFKHYGQDQGLGNLATQRLLQHRAGYLWVGTQNGLFHYDGSLFTGFGLADGLPTSRIEALHETADGVLWVGTRAGVARRRGQRFETVPFERQIEILDRSGIKSDGADRLYLSTSIGLLTAGPAASGTNRHFERVAGQVKPFDPHALYAAVEKERHGGSLLCSIQPGNSAEGG